MNNLEKNSYVKTQITAALLRLMQEKDFHSISIRELANEAGVGRASFYRNYSDKEDVLKQEAIRLTKKWGKEFESNPRSSPFNVFESLFDHYKANSPFYRLLYQAGLSFLLLDTIIEIAGPKPEMDNKEAYGKSFIAYGIYGWVNEWIRRGMQESGKELNEMLSHNQNPEK